MRSEKKYPWVRSLNYVENTSVPVVKLEVKLSLPEDKLLKFPSVCKELVKIDITIDQHQGLKCVELVKAYMLENQVVEPLLLVLKQFLKANELNDPYKGGLSSYGLFLMISSFL